MSAILPLTAVTSPSLLRQIWSAWCSLRWREAGVFGLISLLFGAVDLVWLIEIKLGDELPGALAMQTVSVLSTAVVFVLVWLPVARSDPGHPHRQRRLITAVLLGSILASLISYQLAEALPWPTICDLIVKAQKDSSMDCGHVLWTDIVGNALLVFMPSMLTAAILESRLQRERQEDAAHALLLEHSQLRQRELAARLATLQAQVEPTLLFQALVSIQQAYAAQQPDAGARIERLIRHLRLALPRLRGNAQPLAAEVELIQSYLDVMQDLGVPSVRFEADSPPLNLPPMLLLPLVQRALRLGAPGRCWLHVLGRRLTLGFDAPGLCTEDAELKALHERLAVLDIGLSCTATATDTQFQLQLHA